MRTKIPPPLSDYLKRKLVEKLRKGIFPDKEDIDRLEATFNERTCSGSLSDWENSGFGFIG
jgi:hypothetical protein